MDIIARGAIKAMLLPPGLLVLLMLAGLCLLRRRPRAGRALIGAGLLSLWALATPVVSDWLCARLERFPPVPPEAVAERARGARAIVVLTAGSHFAAPEYGAGRIPDRHGLERARYGAWLAHRTGLPVIVSGGRVTERDGSLADDMARVMERDFGLQRVLREEQSRTTWENALFTARQLGHAGGRRVLLVTHASHMPRAVLSFQRAGLEPVPMPTAAFGLQPRPHTLLGYVPVAEHFARSVSVLHEWLGLVGYRLAY